MSHSTLGMFVEVGAKATALLLLAGVITLALRRASAALRHRVWAVVLAGIVALPLMAAVLPAWELAFARTVASSAEGPRVEAALSVIGDAPGASSQHARGSEGATLWVILVWLFGAAVVGAWLAAGVWGTWRLERRSVEDDWEGLRRAREGAHRRLGIARPVPVAFSEDVRVPLLVGIRRAVIVLPAVARSWTDARLERVLVHELAHHQRLDNLSNLVGRIACCLFWFHPLVWYATHRLRIERELAADDMVVLTGTRASDYAEDLLCVARSQAPSGFLIGATLASQSPITRRVACLLDSARRRAPVSRSQGLACALLAIAAVTVVACATPSPRTEASHARLTADAAPVATFQADGATIDLLAADVPESVALRDAFPMTLYWRVRTPFPENLAPEERWRVFVHFDGPLPLAPYGEEKHGLRFQADHAVNASGTWWKDGSMVEDRFAVTAGQAGFPRGEYAIYVGWFKGGQGRWTNAVITGGSKAPEGYGANRHPLGTITLR